MQQLLYEVVRCGEWYGAVRCDLRTSTSEKLAEKRNRLLEIASSFEGLKLDTYSHRDPPVHRQIKPEKPLPSLSHHILVLHCTSWSPNPYSHENRPRAVRY